MSEYLLSEHEDLSSSLQCHTKPGVATGLPVTSALCVCVCVGVEVSYKATCGHGLACN